MAYEEFEAACFAVLQIGDGNVRGGMKSPDASGFLKARGL